MNFKYASALLYCNDLMPVDCLSYSIQHFTMWLIFVGNFPYATMTHPFVHLFVF